MLALGVLLLSRSFTSGPSVSSSRVAIVLPSEALAEELKLSPDGKRLAFIAPADDGVDAIWVHELESGRARSFEGTHDAWRLFWSTDGRWIGFSTDSQLKKVSLTGAPPEVIWDAGFWGGGSWNQDDVLVVSGGPRDGRVFARVAGTGGSPQPVRVRDDVIAPIERWAPHFLPDGVHFLYFVSPQFQRGAIYLGSLDSEEAVFLLESDAPAVLSEGYLLFTRDGALLAQSFDSDRLRPRGEPLVLGPILRSSQINLGVSAITASQNGALAYRPGTGALGQLVWYDRSGRELGRIPPPPSGEWVNPSMSPNGQRVAVNRRDPATGNVDIWLIDAGTGVASRFTASPAIELDPVWSPDGARIAFVRHRGGRSRFVAMPVDGGTEELLWEHEAYVIPRDWSPDGRFLLCDAASDIWVVPLGEEEPWMLLDSEAAEFGGRFSSDGGWIAYTSNETGAFEVHLMTFPEGSNKQRVSRNGGAHPTWSRSGKELFFWGGTNRVANVMRVELVETSSGLKAGMPEPLFEHRLHGFFDGRSSFAAAHDGERLLLRRPGLDPPPVTVTVNWTAGLEEP